MARWLSKKATCPKKQVGCVVVDINNKVISTGYNKVTNGCVSCIKNPCSKRLKNCHAIHAEALALVKCKQPQAIDTIYVTLSPCFECAKLIAETSCKRVFFDEYYKNNNGLELLKKLNIEIIKYD